MLSYPLTDPATGRLRFRHNSLPPGSEWVWLRGMPTTAGALLSQGTPAISHYSGGVPIDVNGAIAIALAGAVTHVSNGYPFTAAGRLRVAVPATAPAYVHNGTPFTADGYVHGIQV